MQIVEAISLLLVSLFGVFCVVVAYIAIDSYYYQVRLGPSLKRDLGFCEGAAYLQVNRSLHSAVAITQVDEDGVFSRAGFRAGDVLPDLSHTALFKLLHRHRGRVAELAVVDGGEGPPFSKRPRRVIRFAVPLATEQI